MDSLSTFLALVVVANLALLTVQVQATSNYLTSYWSSKLPETLMPPSIQHYLSFDNTTIPSPQFRTSKRYGPIIINIIKCHHGSKKLNQAASSLFALANDVFLVEEYQADSLVVHPRFPSLKGGEGGRFLPRNAVEALPTLTSHNLAKILTTFSIGLKGNAAEVIRRTVDMCENADAEDNVCITSLEGMIDYVASKLGRSNRLRAFSTSLNSSATQAARQAYKVVRAMRVGGVNSAVSCHKVEFPYAVFLCHQRPATIPYMTSLVGQEDGITIQAAMVCHTDTFEWDPQFAGLVVLKVEPGTPVCHFLDQFSVLWVNESSNYLSGPY